MANFLRTRWDRAKYKYLQTKTDPSTRDQRLSLVTPTASNSVAQANIDTRNQSLVVENTTPAETTQYEPPLGNVLIASPRVVASSSAAKRKLTNRDLLDKALALLSGPQRQVIHSVSPLGQASDIGNALNDALAAAQQKQRLCEAHRWTWTFRGRTIVLQDEAKKICELLLLFKAVGDAAGQADPIHIGLPWAGISVILGVTLAESRQMDALLLGMRTAFSMTLQLEAYVRYYAALADHLPLTAFEDVLIEFFALILGFLADAIDAFPKPMFLRQLKVLWKPERFDHFESKARTVSQQVDIVAQMCERDLALQDRKDTQQALHELQHSFSNLRQLESQVSSIHELAENITLGELPIVKEAAIDSYAEQHNDVCLPGTRVDLLESAMTWLQGSGDMHIFWLAGMAGTGKSTLARTVARKFRDDGIGHYCGTFFFKRSANDQRNASCLFSTLAGQLAQQLPAMKSFLSGYLKQHPDTASKDLATQYRRLFLDPLSMTLGTSGDEKVLIVLDALDECENHHDVEEILRLFSAANASIQFRILITSRPLPHIEDHLHNIDQNLLHKITLDDVPHDIIKQDIALFLRHELTMMRKRRVGRQSTGPLTPEWPDEQKIDLLAERSHPLFIYAATVCRLIKSSRIGPKRALDQFLRQASEPGPPMAKLYDMYQMALRESLYQDGEILEAGLVEEYVPLFQALVVFAEPQPANCIARLAKFDLQQMMQNLTWLRPVLHVPSDPDHPIRLLHSSFRDFMLDCDLRVNNPFRVNEKQAHRTLASHCLRVMSEQLRRDICNIGVPSIHRSSIDSSMVKQHISSELRYSCLFWFHHFQAAGLSQEGDNVCASTFSQLLMKSAMHWLETLAWLGHLSDGLYMVNIFRNSCTEPSELHFLDDLRHIIVANLAVVFDYPLQIYCSALIFAPQSSIVRNTLGHMILPQFTVNPQVYSLDHWEHQEHWKYAMVDSRALQFSSDKQRVVAATTTSVIIWDVSTGRSTKKALRDGVSVGTNDCLINLYFLAEDQAVCTISESEVFWINDTTARRIDHFCSGNQVKCVAVSPSGAVVAVGCDAIPRVFHLDKVSSHAFESAVAIHDTGLRSATRLQLSQDGKLLLGRHKRKVHIWDTQSGHTVHQKEFEVEVVNARITTDSLIVVLHFLDHSILFWHIDSGHLKTPNARSTPGSIWMSQGLIPSDSCLSLRGSTEVSIATIWTHPNRRVIGSTVHFLDIASGKQSYWAPWYNHEVKAITFVPPQEYHGPDDLYTAQQFIAAALGNRQVQSWTREDYMPRNPPISLGNESRSIMSHMTIAGNGCTVALAPRQGPIQLWRNPQGTQPMLNHPRGFPHDTYGDILGLAISYDGIFVASLHHAHILLYKVQDRAAPRVVEHDIFSRRLWSDEPSTSHSAARDAFNGHDAGLRISRCGNFIHVCSNVVYLETSKVKFRHRVFDMTSIGETECRNLRGVVMRSRGWFHDAFPDIRGPDGEPPHNHFIYQSGSDWLGYSGHMLSWLPSDYRHDSVLLWTSNKHSLAFLATNGSVGLFGFQAAYLDVLRWGQKFHDTWLAEDADYRANLFG